MAVITKSKSIFPGLDSRFILTFSLCSSHTCHVTTFTLFLDLVNWVMSGQFAHFLASDLYSLYPSRVVVVYTNSWLIGQI
jgi:hypothetical protein